MSKILHWWLCSATLQRLNSDSLVGVCECKDGELSLLIGWEVNSLTTSTTRANARFGLILRPLYLDRRGAIRLKSLKDECKLPHRVNNQVNLSAFCLCKSYTLLKLSSQTYFYNVR